MGLEHRPSGSKGARGRKLPPSPNPQGGDDEEEDENGVEGEVTLAPHSPPHEDLCSLGNIFSRHARISIGTHRQKWPQTEIELSTSPPPLPFLTVVSPGL
jgi:hypothetical protein